MAQLILDDEYVKAAAQYLRSISAAAQERVDNICFRLREVECSGITSGATHDALVEYEKRAKALKGKITEFGSECASLANGFLKEIDELDQELYN